MEAASEIIFTRPPDSARGRDAGLDYECRDSNRPESGYLSGLQLREDRNAAQVVRQACSRGPEGDRVCEGFRLRGRVVAQARRARDLLEPQRPGGETNHQSPGPSPRPAYCLSAPDRCPRSVDLRADSGRADAGFLGEVIGSASA